MIKTLKISFSLRNTYRVNSILYSLKQIPLVKRLLPAALYQVRGLKIFANILALLWEGAGSFPGKRTVSSHHGGACHLRTGPEDRISSHSGAALHTGLFFQYVHVLMGERINTTP